MIARLRGELVATEPPYAIVDCGGVGYEVMLPAPAFNELPACGNEVLLHTSMQVREDSHQLFGFLTPEERRLFLAFIKVNGVGAKSAIALLSALDPATLAQAVEEEDPKSLTRAPGIGLRSAERIIMELRGKDMMIATPALPPAHRQAVDGLVALGYTATKARGAVAGIDTKDKPVAEIIKLALAKLSGGR